MRRKKNPGMVVTLRMVLVVSGLLAVTSPSLADELRFPGKELAKLDTFEGMTLQDANKLFLEKDYTGAYAAYEAFSLDFDTSRAMPFVLFRMGRCRHRVGKRYAAIKSYQDVVDYFPDSVRYAAAALFYMGKCHEENGDTAKQTAVWARMAKDDDYVNEPNSGTALAFLADAMENLKKMDEATEYRWRTAVAFAKSNRDAARKARDAVIRYYTRQRPNHDELKQFFIDTNAFGDRHGKGGAPEEDKRYWNKVFDQALRAQANEKNVCRYWVSQFGKRFVEDEGLRVKLFRMQYVYEKDLDAWAARMEKQLTRVPVTMGRVVRWTRYYYDHEAKQRAFLEKHAAPLIKEATARKVGELVDHMRRESRSDFFEKHIAPTVAGRTDEEKVELISRLNRHRMTSEIQRIIRTVRTGKMTDKQLRRFVDLVARNDSEETVLRYISRMKDDLFAAKTRFDYYNARTHRNRPFMEKALAEIPVLEKSPKYANEVSWAKARLLHQLGRYDEAIKAYQSANRQPDSTWGIADCLVAMKAYGRAIKTVEALEAIGGGIASRACLRVADIYKAGGDKGKEVQQLRKVLRRYKGSRESSVAHIRLEGYGLKVTGGEAEAEE